MNLLPLIELVCIFHASGLLPSVAFRDWLLSLRIICSRSIDAVTWVRTVFLFIAK